MQQNDTIFVINAHHFNILRGVANSAHLASHFLAFEHFTRVLTLTSRTMRTVRYRHAMRRTKTTKIMPLHCTRKTLTLGGANDINLSDRQQNGLQLMMRQHPARHHHSHEIQQALILATHSPWRNDHALAWKRFWLWQHQRQAGERYSHLFDVAHRNNLYIIEFQNGDWHMMASIVKHSGHAQFTGDNAATHNSGPLPKA